MAKANPSPTALELRNEINALRKLEQSIRQFASDRSNIIHQDVADALREVDRIRKEADAENCA